MKQVFAYNIILIYFQSIVLGRNSTNDTATDDINQTIISSVNNSTNDTSNKINNNNISEYPNDDYDDNKTSDDSNDTVISKSTLRIGDEDIVFRIIKGKPAKPRDVPYMVGIMERIKRSTRYRATCGACLIGPNKVLSAASCVAPNRLSDCFKGKLSKKDFKNMLVVAGLMTSTGNTALKPKSAKFLYTNQLSIGRTHKLSNSTTSKKSSTTGKRKNSTTGKPRNGTTTKPRKGTTTKPRNNTSTMRVTQWRVIRRGRYPKDFKKTSNDIAVLYTDKRFSFNNFVYPVQLPSRKSINYNSSTCVIAGYGSHIIPFQFLMGNLLIGEVKLLPRRTCTQILRQDTSKTLCSSETFAGIAMGDHGGPLVCKNTGDPRDRTKQGVLAGIMSAVYIVPEKNGTVNYNVYTRVTSYMKFINTCSCLTPYPYLCIIVSLLINNFNKRL